MTAPHTTDPPALEIDFSPYAPFLEDESISDEDKRELLEALWSIIVSFAQLGHGIHPVQQAKAAKDRLGIACGQIGERAAQSPAVMPSVVEYNSDLLVGEFDAAAERAPQEARQE